MKNVNCRLNRGVSPKLRNDRKWRPHLFLALIFLRGNQRHSSELLRALMANESQIFFKEFTREFSYFGPKISIAWLDETIRSSEISSLGVLFR